MKKKIIAALTVVSFAPAFVSAQITNPLAFDTLEDFFVALLDVIIIIATPIVVVMIVYSGFLFVTAAGNVEKLGRAKKTFIYALLGALILLGAQAISLGIEGTVDELRTMSLIFYA